MANKAWKCCHLSNFLSDVSKIPKKQGKKKFERWGSFLTHQLLNNTNTEILGFEFCFTIPQIYTNRMLTLGIV